MSGGHVLVVDDDELSAKLAAMLLEASGYRVSVAHDARQVMAAVDAEVPDLILLDMVLPDVDGFELAQRLRRMTRTATIPIIAVTGFAGEGDELKCREAGCDGYLTKPIDQDGFLGAVRTHLGRT